MSKRAIEVARDKVREAKREYRKVVCRTVVRCKHRNLGECEHEVLYRNSCLRPERVCLDCGLTEEGWGYDVLTGDNVRKMGREEVYRSSTVRVENEDKGSLMRGEITLGQLVKEKLDGLAE